MSTAPAPLPEFQDFEYVRRPSRVLRLRLCVPPAPRPPPLILYIPMSGMRACDMANASWWLCAAGFAVASLECRVSSEAIAPAAVHDCKAGIAWLRSQATRLGFNGSRIGVYGHSAGGLLASLMGTSGDHPAVADPAGPSGVSTRVQAVCDACGAPHDLAWFARPAIIARFAPVVENLRLYLGGPVEQRLDLARLVSPSTYISPACPPMLLIHGTADALVPVAETQEFHQALLAAGVDSTLVLLPGVGHAWDPALTRSAITAFFRRTLG